MVCYSFITQGKIKAPAEHVWAAIEDIEAMPGWWKAIRCARIIGQDKKLKVGRQIRFSVKGLLGNLSFTVKVTEFETLRRIKLQSTGDLKGYGLFTLEEEDGFTNLTYRWEVATTGKLMNFCGRVLKPLLVYNHDRVMKKGFKNLKVILEV